MQYSIVNNNKMSSIVRDYISEFLPRQGIQAASKPEALVLPTCPRSSIGVIYFPGAFANPEKKETRRVRFAETSVKRYPLYADERLEKKACYRNICSTKSENFWLSEAALRKNFRIDESRNEVREYYLSPEERRMKQGLPSVSSSSSQKKQASGRASQRRDLRQPTVVVPAKVQQQKEAKNPIRRVVGKVASKVAACSSKRNAGPAQRVERPRWRF